MRALLIALAALTAACSPAAAPSDPAPPAPPSAEAVRDELLAALTPVITQDIGQPVSFETSTVNVQDDWAYVVAQPLKADGTQIDWATTNLASRHENGVLDSGGTTYALLQRRDGAWTVVEHVIGPTDVAWLEWPSRHGVQPTLLNLPAE